MRYYSNVSKSMTLSAGIGAGDSSITVNDASGLPVVFPYVVAIGYQTAQVELVLVTGAVANTLTVTRGQEDTSAQSHSIGASVIHVGTAKDFQDSQDHIAAAGNVHGVGVSSNVVGTGTIQTLTNKTMSGSANTFSNIPGSALSQPLSLTDLAVASDNTAPALKATATTAGFAAIVAKQNPTPGAANLQEWQDSSATILAKVASDGKPTFPGGTYTGQLTLSGASVLSVGGTSTLTGLVTATAGVAAASSLDVTRALAANTALSAKVSGDAQQRLVVGADGKVNWGPGTGATDTVLYRNTTGVLKTDAAFAVGTALTVSGVSDFFNDVTLNGATTDLVVGGNVTASAGIATLGTTTIGGSGLSVSAGGAAISGNSSVSGNLDVTGTVTGIGTCKSAVKTADTTRVSTSTLAADPHLAISLPANTTWVAMAQISYIASLTPGLKFAWNGPVACTADNWTAVWTSEDGVVHGSAFGTISNAGTSTSASGSGDKQLSMYATIVVGVNAGTVSVRWSQNTSDASSVIFRSGSYLTMIRVA